MPASFKKLRDYSDFSTDGLLFDMKNDPEQRVNLYEKYPEKVNEMKQMLQQYRENERTVNH